MRVMVVWCPDWSVVAALDEAERSPRSPAAVLVRQRRGGLQRPRPRRGRTPGAAPPRRAGAVPRAGAAARQPRPRRPRLRAGAGRGRGPAARGGRRCGPGCSRSGHPAAGTAARPTAAATARRGGWSRTGVWDVPDRRRRRPVHRRAGRPARPSVQDCGRRRAGGVRVPFLRGLPVDVLQDDGRRGRERSACCSGSGCAPSATSPTCRRDAVRAPVRHATSPRCTGWSAARHRRCFAAAHPAARAGRHVDFEPPLDNVETISFSVRQTADRVVAQLARLGAGRTEVRVEAECEGAVSLRRRATWLHPRWFTAADLVDRLHWQLQGAVGGRCAAQGRRGAGAGRPGAVRAGDRRSPTPCTPTALWGGTDERVERGIARVQGMLGHDAVVRPVLQGGRSPGRPAGAGAVGRAADRAAPASARRGRAASRRPRRPGCCASPWPAEVVDAGGRPVGVDERGAVTGEPAAVPARPVGGGWQPVAAWAGPWPVEELLVGGRDGRDGSPASRSSASTAGPG